MKKLFTLLLLAVASFVQAFAQPVAETPEAYEALKTYYEEFERIQLTEFDYTIPASERILFAPSAYSQDAGNWATDWHGTANNASWIEENGERKVAAFVLDTGAGYTNSRMNAAWWREKGRVFTGEQNTIDVQSHSTHVSSSIGGVDPNKPIGLAAELVKMGLLKIIPYKVLNDQGSAYTSWIVAGIEAAILEAIELQKQGYFCIINLSLGGRGQSAAMDAVIQKAEDAGILVFAAAGNGGSPNVGTPANGPGAVAVAAHDRNGKKASFSDYGEEIETAAAGVGILGLLPNEGEGEYNGTSMATPTAAACAAIIASTNPELDSEGVKAILFDKVYDIDPQGWDQYTGHGSFVLDLLINDPTPPDNPDNPDNPDTPDNPDEPEQPEEPEFTSTLTYEVNGEKMYYRTQSESKFEPLELNDMVVTVSGKGNTDAVYDQNDSWTKNYFRNTRLVVPETPEWGHCLTTYWSGQFYEYTSRNQGIGAQVTAAKGTDEEGRNCLQYTFDRAEVAHITSFTNDKGFTILTAQTEYGQVMAIRKPERKGFLRRIFSR